MIWLTEPRTGKHSGCVFLWSIILKFQRTKNKTWTPTIGTWKCSIAKKNLGNEKIKDINDVERLVLLKTAFGLRELIDSDTFLTEIVLIMSKGYGKCLFDYWKITSSRFATLSFSRFDQLLEHLFWPVLLTYGCHLWRPHKETLAGPNFHNEGKVSAQLTDNAAFLVVQVVVWQTDLVRKLFLCKNHV